MTAVALRDLLGRAGWVTLYAVVAYVTKQVADLGDEWLLLLLPGLSVLKNGLGAQVGDKGDTRFTSKPREGIREDGLIFGEGPHFGGE